ncbi:MAG: SDR family oxidoreductase [Rhodoferax sp.]|nr:SDR family oxidoreductase [Rhodoferax sp.]
MAERFAIESVRIATCDVNAATLDEARMRHPEWHCIHTDVSNEDQVGTLFDTASSALRGLDILVINAGIAGSTAPIETILTRCGRPCMRRTCRAAFYAHARRSPYSRFRVAHLVHLDCCWPLRCVVSRAICVGQVDPCRSCQYLGERTWGRAHSPQATPPGPTRGARLDGVMASREKTFGRTFDEQKAIELRSAASGIAANPDDIANAVAECFLMKNALRNPRGQDKRKNCVRSRVAEFKGPSRQCPLEKPEGSKSH